ncbi:MAG: PAS domain S-box protein, partial [Prosthecobacter sp.]|nr:PAS domain S-box protein [Prosthecobacter sp.]
ETLHQHKDGSAFPVEVSSRLFEIEGRPYRQSIIRDISERRLTAEKIERQLKELQQWYAATLDREGRVAELKAEVNALRRKMGEPPRFASQDADK